MEYALQEEIGHPEFFVGRKQELADLLEWAEGTKKKVSKSRALLARRKKGKTALVQRLFNTLYTANDAQVVPFYFRVQEGNQSSVTFAKQYYRTFISQFLGFQLRRPELMNAARSLTLLKEYAKDDPDILLDIKEMEEYDRTKSDLTWVYARQAPHRIADVKGIRIIQIIDEFQYMNRYIYHDEAMKHHDDFCHHYMDTAESNIAPLIFTGSDLDWLTSRLHPYHLHGLTDEEALETVYNYATLMNIEITDSTAPYIAELTGNEPFYISQMIRTDKRDLNLITKEGVRSALQFETTFGQGVTANMWMEYIHEAFARVNEKNAVKLVLYLAKFGNKERSRVQIHEDLKLTMSDAELEYPLYKLTMTDLIAWGSSYFRYKGLGDPIFAAVFRKVYAEEIERLDPETIREDFNREMTQMERQNNWHKGLGGEYKVMFHLLAATTRGAALADIVFNHQQGYELNPFADMHKERIYKGHESSREVDIYARSEAEDGTDLVIEVKNWKQEVSNQAVTRFIELKQDYAAELKAKTGFLLYSENGFTETQKELMESMDIMYTTPQRLTAYLER